MTKDDMTAANNIARLAVQKIKHKDLDHVDAGTALCVHGLALIYELETDEAAELFKQANAYCLRVLSQRVLDEVAPHCTPEELARLKTKRAIGIAQLSTQTVRGLE